MIHGEFTKDCSCPVPKPHTVTWNCERVRGTEVVFEILRVECSQCGKKYRLTVIGTIPAQKYITNLTP